MPLIHPFKNQVFLFLFIEDEFLGHWWATKATKSGKCSLITNYNLPFYYDEIYNSDNFLRNRSVNRSILNLLFPHFWHEQWNKKWYLVKRKALVFPKICWFEWSWQEVNLQYCTLSLDLGYTRRITFFNFTYKGEIYIAEQGSDLGRRNGGLRDHHVEGLIDFLLFVVRGFTSAILKVGVAK